WDRLLFSAKESVYKAWFPLARRWLGFEEADVTLDPAGRFTARLLVPGPVSGFTGRWTVHNGQKDGGRKDGGRLVGAAIVVMRRAGSSRSAICTSRTRRTGPSWRSCGRTRPTTGCWWRATWRSGSRTWSGRSGC